MTAQRPAAALEAALPPAEEEDVFSWPLFGLQDDVRPALRSARSRGEASVLATLYAVSGGAPRGVGAQMLITDKEITGYLSGGCIEADVAVHARSVLGDARPRRLVYGEGGPADIRLPCGSRIDVVLERVGPEDPAAGALLALEEARRPAVWLSDGQRRLCRDAAAAAGASPLEAILHERRGTETCGRSEHPFGFFRFHPPRLRLVVMGGDPIALAVARLGEEIGLEIVIVRPKGPETPPPVPARYLRSGAAEALAAVAPDPWTAVAILTHDADQEHEALLAALTSDAGYLGALGSRRRIPERNARLLAAGASAAALKRIRAPIGLPIGGKSPWEIAVSIIAQIVADLGRGA
jgi:xanthine dehydrogenase accessory factor